MPKCSFQPLLRALALASVVILLAACGGTKPDLLGAANVPASFDVTLLSDKDNLFDFDGAPLTEQDLLSALRYRKDEGQPTASVLLKRGDKKITKQHIISLARVAYNLKIKAFLDDDGSISEIRAQLKGDAEPAKPAEEKRHHGGLEKNQ